MFFIKVYSFISIYCELANGIGDSFNFPSLVVSNYPHDYQPAQIRGVCRNAITAECVVSTILPLFYEFVSQNHKRLPEKVPP